MGVGYTMSCYEETEGRQYFLRKLTDIIFICFFKKGFFDLDIVSMRIA